MKIVYGIAGEGQGHLSRSKEIVDYLKKKGHEILVITYGQAYSPISKDYPVIKINGIHPIFKKNKMRLMNSLRHNSLRVLKDLKRWKEINKQIKKFCPDLFITDFEPFTARLAYYNKKPLISIDNQHLLLQEIPKDIKSNNYRDFLVSKYASKFCVPKAKLFILLSLYKIKIKTKRTIIMDPIIRSEIKKHKPRKGSHVLVYLSKADDGLIKILRNIPGRFIIYGCDRNATNSNLIFKKNNEGFVKNLLSCKAVIATAGFSLISESIFLKKPYFALPYYHFEQLLNAHFIKNKGFGEFSKVPSATQIITFLSNLPTYEKNLGKKDLSKSNSLELINKAINDCASNRG
ncbi:MAG: glycosyltransferase family protein [Nanoarchaeota archaeon]|nr:glycosyltransferase family protein [Nanoarchaeota archaeon]